MSFKLLRKLISVLIILAFFFTNINTSYAAPGSKSLFKNKKVDYNKLSNERQDSLEKKQSIIKGEDAKEVQSQKKEAKKILSSHLEDISQIHIPQELGRITEVYNNASSSDKKPNLIVHIQDLHTNPEAELNLAKILELLLKDYDMSLVCSEGADGKVDTSSISSFPDSQAKERVSRIFIDSGELTGEEYLSITKYPELPIWGIEDRDIYFKNIIGFNNIMKFSPDSQVFISQVKKAITELKPKVYSKDLLDLDQKESEFSSQKLDTAKYIQYLDSFTKKLNISMANYKNISLLTETMETEKTIDQLKIMNQSQNLLLNLQSTLQSRFLNNDLDGLMARANLFKDQKISPFSFYSYLKDLANKHLKENFASKYPEFNSFVDYLTKVNLLDSTKLFTELEDLNYEIKEALSKTDEQKTLVKADHNISFLESFFNLKVSNEDLDYYLNNKDSHKVAFFKDFFSKVLKKYNINAFIDYDPLLIDSHLQELEDFYKIVKDRDIAMVTNSLSEIEKRSSKVSSLIAGGFHTKGITRLLREKGYSYIVVSPYSKTDIDEENYHFLLSGRRKPIADLIKKYLNLPEIVNRLAPSTLRVPLAYSETAKAFAEQITGAVGGERTAADLAKSMASLLGLDNHAALWAGFGDKGIAGLSPEPGVVVVPWGNKYLEIKANEVVVVSAERYNGKPVVNMPAAGVKVGEKQITLSSAIQTLIDTGRADNLAVQLLSLVRDADRQSAIRAIRQLSERYAIWTNDWFEQALATLDSEQAGPIRDFLWKEAYNREYPKGKLKVGIMAGGGGTRLRPWSHIIPKQLLGFLGVSGRSMIQEAVARLLEQREGLGDAFSPEDIYILTVDEFVPAIRKQLTVLGEELGFDATKIRFVIEPVLADTAAAMANGAAEIEQGDPDAIMAILTADHVMNTYRLRELLRNGAIAANNNMMVTIGIKPDAPNEDFGHLRRAQDLPRIGEGISRVERFTEKPKEQAAIDAFNDIASDGSHMQLFNSGMFIGSVKTWFRALQTFSPDYVEQFDKIRGKNRPSSLDELKTRLVAIFKEIRSWTKVEGGRYFNKGSGDFRIMEPMTAEENSKHFGMVMMNSDSQMQSLEWADVGSHKQAYEQHIKAGNGDANGNVMFGPDDLKPRVIMKDSNENVIVVTNPHIRSVEIKGLTRHIVDIIGAPVNPEAPEYTEAGIKKRGTVLVADRSKLDVDTQLKNAFGACDKALGDKGVDYKIKGDVPEDGYTYTYGAEKARLYTQNQLIVSVYAEVVVIQEGNTIMVYGGDYFEEGLIRALLLKHGQRNLLNSLSSDCKYAGSRTVDDLLKKKVIGKLAQKPAEFLAIQKTVLYNMIHGLVPTPRQKLGKTSDGSLQGWSTLNFTPFSSGLLTEFPDGEIVKTTGHFNPQLDIQQVAQGEFISLQIKYDDKGNPIENRAQYLKPGDIFYALPGYFHVTIPVGEGPHSFFDIGYADGAYKEVNYNWPNSTPAPYLFVNRGGKITTVLNPDYKNKEIPPIQWYTADKLPEAEGHVSLIDLYAKADEPGMSRILDAIEAGSIEVGGQVAPPPQVEMTFSEEKTFSLEYIAMVPAVKGGINGATIEDPKKRLPDNKLPVMPVEQFNFMPAGYDTAVESLNAIQAVQKKFQEITNGVNWSGTVTKDQVEKVGLDWEGVSKILIDPENNWAKQVSPTDVFLTADIDEQKNQMLEIFGDNFYKVLPILQQSLAVRSPRQVLEWMTQAIEETPEGAGVFISIDMNADNLQASDGTYYLGDDAKRFGNQQKDGFVRYKLAIEYYQLLATDFSRLIAIEHAFTQGHDEAWQRARATAALGEINLDHDNRFVSLPVDSMAEWISQAAKSTVFTFQGTGFLHKDKTGPDVRVRRGTLDSAIIRKSLEIRGKAKAAQYPEGSLRASPLTYEPKHTGMGTSGFRGRVDQMRDFEPYAIASGFVKWLIKRGQLEGELNDKDELIKIKPGQKIALSGDFRDSSPDFMAAALKAYEDIGVEAVFLGYMATPNMAYYCKKHGIAGIMITGSHTEGKYNGLKLYDIDGEVLNEADEVDGDKESDRREIMAQVDMERDQLYRQPRAKSHFNNKGYFKRGVKPNVKALMVTEEAIRINEEGRKMYVQRTIDMFQGKRPFEGHAIVYWVHSTVVAREHIAMLEALGMEVIRVGERAKDFIALDTENMTEDHLTYLKEQVELVKKICNAETLLDGRVRIKVNEEAYGILKKAGFNASENIIGKTLIFLGESSSDGDGDRSVVVDEKGRFWRGDVTGAIVAETLGAEYFVQSLTGNQDTIDYLQQRGVNFVTSSVGSPYHVFLIRQLLRLYPDAKIMGQEVNGGTFIGGNNFKVSIKLANELEFELNIDELNTRDAAFPMLIVFLRSVMDQKPVSELFEGNLDNYADNAGLIHEMPVIPSEKRTGVLIHRKYTPEGRYGLNIKQVVFNDEENTIEVTYRGADARKETVTHNSDLGEKLLTLRKELQGFFSAGRGFGTITQMAYGNLIDDGFVMWDSNGDRFHVRRSGNAPETRIYVYAADKNTKRAADIIKMATEPGGILREIEASVWKVEDVLNWLRGGRDQAVNAFKANPMLLQIHCSVQPYDWGDTNFIPALLEIDNKEGKPFAELWIGAHPLLPAKANVSRIEINLNDLISGAAEEMLGKDVAVQFNKQLPYLLKVLAAGKMLSIQAHPNKKQAEAGFDRENAKGVSINALNRNYKDANHKPELIAVVTDFYALNGFRPLEEIAGLLEDIEEFQDIMPDFRQRLNVAGQDEAGRKELIKELYARVMSQKIMHQKRVDEILGPLIERLSKQSFSKDDREFWVLKAAEQYTKDGHIDRGIFSIYLLNFIHLRPGEAMYLKAGELHAYLEGVGMECMANSDNVLRGGLTPKYIDVAELLTILTFNSGKPDILKSRKISETEALYDVPVKEFMLSVIEVSPGKVHKNTELHSADALIVMEGEVEIKTKEHAIKLKKGDTIIIPAILGEYEITGQGKLYKVSIPLEAATIAEKVRATNPAAASSL